MVRTGNRAAALERLLVQAGYEPSNVVPNAPRLADLSTELVSSVLNTFRKLGGTSEAPSLRPGSWDLSMAGGLVVELDEELHFNRYRALTLGEPWSAQLPWQSDYLAYSASREGDCLSAGKWGKRWTNPSCERMFGLPDNPGQFDAGGAPRWKQRALYDAVKDAAGLCRTDIKLVRVSTFDRVGDIQIGAALEGNAAVDIDAFGELVGGRIA